MSDAESGRASAEVREEPTEKPPHGNPMSRYLGALIYGDRREPKIKREQGDE